MDDHSQPSEKNLGHRIWHRISDKSKVPRRWWLPAESISFTDDEQWQRQHDEVSSTIRRVMLAIVAYSLFCILALGAPDVNLIANNANIKLPFVDTEVSYSGFLIAGPLILVGLFVYLHIFVGYLGKLASPNARVSLPFIFNMQSSLPRLVSDVLLYYMVPVVLLVFTWKAAPRTVGILLLLITLLVGVGTFYLKIQRFQWSTPPTKLQQARYRSLWLMLALLFGLTCYAPAMPLYRPLMLFKADLSDLDLRRTNFKNAVLIEANLRGAILVTANLEGAKLEGAILEGANLEGANLRGANLRDKNLEGVNLRGANLRSANLVGADLRGKNLEGANLLGAKLEDANLEGANLKSAILWRANLRGKNLKDAILEFANLEGANLEFAKLEGAKLEGAKLEGANLAGANLAGANLRGASLVGANLESANLQGAELSCDQLTKGLYWKESYRILELSCGAAIPKLPTN